MTNTLPAWLEEWPQLQAISDVPAVHEALENFSHDSTEDAACLLIKEIARALLSEHVLCGREPVAFRFGSRQQYVGAGWPAPSPTDPTIGPLYAEATTKESK